VYLYSTRDEPGPADRGSSVLPPNIAKAPPETHNSNSRDGDESQGVVEEDEETAMEAENLFGDNENHDDIQADEPDDDDDGRRGTDIHADVSVIYPRMRFSGHCNVETVKDVNFLDPYDEYVASGSDDGNFFIWKKSGELVDILEGDGSVVNVIEGHPTLPLVAVSGIDTTIKLFSPARGPAIYSKYQNASSIMRRNARASRRGLSHSVNLQLVRFIMQHQDRDIMGEDGDDDDDSETRLAQCINQ